MKTIGFAIKIPLTKESLDSKKQLGDFHKGLDTLGKKTLPALTKSTKTYLKDTRDGLRDATTHVERFGTKFSESMRKGLEGINRLNEKLHKSRERIFGLKEAFEATAIGAATFYGAEKLIEGGRNEMRTRMRVRREFGSEAGFISEAGERAARRSGLEGADATRMLIPLAETLRDTVQAGSRFRGMKGPLSAAQAADLRRKNLEVGSSLMQRMAVLNPQMGAGEIGQVMNDALTGPEGVRSMISSFGLSKRSRSLSEANEKGQAYKALSPDERKQLGVTKAGQYVQQADLVRLMLERSGFTAGAANDEMKTLDFQLKAIGSSFKNVFGEIGESMMSKLDGGLAKGGTLSERLNTYLDKNKGTIRHIGEELGTAAKAVGELAGYLPSVGAFLSQHRTTFEIMAAGFVGFKALAGIGGMFGKASKIPGLGGLAGGKAGLPVYVTNWDSKDTPGKDGDGGGGFWGKLWGVGKKVGLGIGSVAAAGGVGAGLILAAASGAAGYAGGKGGLALNAHSNRAARFYDAEERLIERLTGGGSYKALEDYESARNKRMLEAGANKRQSLVSSLETAGLSHGQAVAIATGANHDGFDVNRGNQTIHISLNADGKVLADVVVPHITRHVRNRTADGAAPTWR